MFICKRVPVAVFSLAAMCAASGSVFGATYYVDSVAGDDVRDGLTESSAWKSLEKVNSAKLNPGDVVRFKRGGLWRGSLKPQSGTPEARITYTSYGVGVKPIIQPSVDMSKPGDWEETEPGIWATKKAEPILGAQVWSAPQNARWSPSFQEGYKGTCKPMEENGRRFVRVQLDKRGNKVARNLLQMWGPEMNGLPECVLLKFEMRASIPFMLSDARVMEARYPYTASHSGKIIVGESIGTEWQEVSALMPSRHAKLNGSGYLHLNLGDVLPLGGYVDIRVIGAWSATVPREYAIERDVGIFVINHGEKWGVKRWGLHGSERMDWTPPAQGRWINSDRLVNDLDYWYDARNMRVFVKSNENPGTRFKSIELAKTVHAVGENCCHDVTYDGLWIRYAAAHGFGGGSTANITIRNCDISWIGGGLQYWRKHEKTGKTTHPVRFGNGIEFWGNCRNCLVERCRLWEVYDAALTNQGTNDSETEVTWRDNVIWNSEYSYEYWNRKLTRNILFEHNTCVDAGYGWAHSQRPDVNGAHLMYYHNRAATTNFVVRNNIFCRATEWTCRSGLDWRYGLTQNHNLVYNEPNIPYLRWLEGKSLVLADWQKYRDLGFETEGMNAKPLFVNEAKRDYRLTKDSPGYAGLSTDGTPVGARSMPGLDDE